MFSNVRQSSPFDGILIDERNERPLRVALATIVVVWSIAFALTLAWVTTGANSASLVWCPSSGHVADRQMTS